MNRRILKLLSLWILPLLIARAMIPAGYMLSTADGLQLMFCPGVLQPASMSLPAPAMDHSAHAGHHDMSQHAGHHSEAASDDTSHEVSACPFSLVAAAALLDASFVATDSIRAPEERVDFTTGPAVSAGPLHVERIRGPPQFS
ncbi:hypothetical protein [Povalibacter sp.]|uniref:hypothetical protein n=1 Tax=Povalibacter sp. TaxID=1962978 RepID=UPI002F3F43ED